jgi:hypothetical protein
MSAILYGADGIQFCYNWDGLWIGSRPGTDERIVAFRAPNGDWGAYRQVIPSVTSYRGNAARAGWTAYFPSLQHLVANWTTVPERVES